jgi:SOS-response transcriptional repressor LexA
MKDNQKIIISFVEEFIQKHGFSPSIREISESLGYDFSTINYRIKSLVNKGYLSFLPGKQRTLRVIKEGDSAEASK